MRRLDDQIREAGRGAATAAQAVRVIDEHLLNPKEFFPPHSISTVALGDPKFELRANQSQSQ